jgi:hypothetical protein
MKTTHVQSLGLRLALCFILWPALGVIPTGCSTAEPSTMPAPAPGGGDGSGDGSGVGDGDDLPGPPKPLDAAGKYAIHSTFDLATNMPGTAGAVVNTIIDATDGGDDPTAWIVDQIIDRMPDGPVKSALDFAKLFVVGYLNDKLLEIAPDLLSTMLQVGRDFGTVARQFGLNETLELTRSTSGYTAVHTVTGIHIELDNQKTDLAFAHYHLSNIAAQDIAVTMDGAGQLAIAAHDVPLAYGQILRIGLDAAIIPLIDASAQNLNELLAHQINCERVGEVIMEALDEVLPFSVGSPALFASACSLGITGGATYVYAKIAAIDGIALRFGLSGTARGIDKNNDRNIDAIQTGTWAGMLSYGATPTPLIPAAFSGERMQ